MLGSGLFGDARGSAALEFVSVGVILLVPFAYLVLVLGAVQDQLLGVESAARHAARIMSTAPDGRAAQERADLVLAAAIGEYGMEPGAVDVRVSCAPAGSECPSPGAVVTVTVGTRVSLPFIPSVFGLDRLGAIPIEATSVCLVPRVRGEG